MGKVLVFKDADFSDNALDSLTPIGWNNLVLETGGINLIGTSDPNFGTEIETTPSGIRMRADLNVYIGGRKTIHFRGLKGLNGEQVALRIDACMYTADARTRANAAHSLSKGNSNNYFPINTEGKATASVTNEYDTGYYFGFVFSGQTKNENLSPSSYSPIQYYIE